MKKSLAHWLVGGAIVAAALPSASPASAQPIACSYYRPGLIALVTGIRPAGPCVYQGDYLVQQGPVYSGPAVIAPQPTYSPSPTLAGYLPGPYRVYGERVVRRIPATRVSVENELPPGIGKVEIVHARAEVRIYGRERMDIRLYRR
jgi:hypothetical protein